MLDELGVPDWYSDAPGSSELLIETSGKMCYMSFDTSLNENLTVVNGRTNWDYVQQAIIGNGHTSVLEHCVVNLAFTNVSRVLTHELVRHRVGAAYSQTSGRYVRLSELPFWVPSCIKEDPVLEEMFCRAIEQQEESLAAMVAHTGINDMKDFSKKKELTSALRRIIGNGVANNIMCSYNHRALRHILELRSSRHAEEEIRLAMSLLFLQVSARYPVIYADAVCETVNGLLEITFGKQA